MLSVLLYSILRVQVVYSVQLNCTYSNYGETDWDCYVEFVTVQYIYLQILYKLYTLNLNCTYSNYTEAAATYSAVQEHSTFNVLILYTAQCATELYLQ